jgi:hypothetical protein
MAYTRESIAEPTTAVPTAIPAVMRDPVSIDPYAHSKARETKLSSIGQTNKINESQPVETKAPAESVTLSPQVAALARKEQKYRQDQEKLKADREALSAEKAKLAQLEELQTKLAAKDYSGLEDKIDYEAYTQYLLNKQQSTDPKDVALKELKDEVTGIKKANQEYQEKQFEAAVNERKLASAKLLATDPKLSAFQTKVEKANPAVKLPDVITQHILDTWEHESEELSVEQATQEVQNAITEKAKAWASVLDEEPREEKKQLPPLKQGLKTITNQVTAGELTRAPKSYQNMSDSERWAEARRRAEAKLQQKG